MPHVVAAFVCGLLFGGGLAVSDMVNPAKVLNFLDVAGAWDASLVFVMGGAVAVTAIGYRLVFGRDRPVLADSFSLPTARDVDARLLAGAAVFGVGWGLAGLCPGPALAGLTYARPETLIFLAAMAVGLIAGRLAADATQPTAPTQQGV
ncbi:MAG: DUF6691 family protein [Rhodospirillaceae bacterium]|nr:DUF6691 family protein [Rhodospirillaceae bacterium]